MENIPFVFGKIALDNNFTDREKETALLSSNFRSLVNTMILSPRRWGKSSLVNKVREALKNDTDVKIVTLDLFTIRSEEDFYVSLASAVLKSTSNRFEDAMEFSKAFLSRLIPKITFSPDNQNEFSFGIDLPEIKKDPSDILNLAESIATRKNIKIIICIDEFQNISHYDDPLSFQKKLRAFWQHHKNVAYCLYGSKKHMLYDVFSNPSMPFYKFGDLLFLQKISTQDWQIFIQRRFKETGKEITSEQAKLIAVKVDDHPYYVQQLAQQVWLRTEKICSDSIINDAHSSLLDQLSLIFTSTTDNLSRTQLNLLLAIIADETQLSSKSVIMEYKLGTSANVNRLKQSLLLLEILDDQPGTLTFQDPLYRDWLRKVYIKK